MWCWVDDLTRVSRRKGFLAKLFKRFQKEKKDKQPALQDCAFDCFSKYNKNELIRLFDNLESREGDLVDGTEVLEMSLLLKSYPDLTMDSFLQLIDGIRVGVVDGSLIGKSGMVRCFVPVPTQESKESFDQAIKRMNIDEAGWISVTRLLARLAP